MPIISEIYLNSDNVVEALNVTNVTTGDYINDASVTLSLVDKSTGVQIIAVGLSYIPSSNGGYRGIIPYDTPLAFGQELVGKLSIDGGDGLKKYYEISSIAVVDKS